ncbi:hypothetical protein M0R36_11420, partial [bacterium]|nr:hypothetical protein [bacterium]
MSKYTTFPICLIPSIQNDDPTRCQMAASQLKQSLILENPDIPMISTGYDNISHLGLYHKYADKSGIVLYRNNQILILKYDDGNCETFRMYWYIKCNFNKGDKFNSGDLLFEHVSTDNGIIKYGKNMLVAYMEYFGYCHEDSIVFSESAASKFTSDIEDELTLTINPNEVLLSLEKDNYKPLPRIGDVIKKNDPLLLVKYLSGNPRFLCEEPKPYYLKNDVVVTDVKFFINDWCKNYGEYNQYIVSILEESKKMNEELSKLKGRISDIDLERACDIMNCDIHKYKGKINDKNIRVDGLIVSIKYTYKKHTQVGDKYSNRHGNKGVISIIVPDNEMPITPWGQPIDIILSDLSIISRMNMGQLFELHGGLSLHFLKNQLSELYEKDPDRAIANLISVMTKVDSTNGKWYSNEIINAYKKYGPDKRLIDDLILIQPPFESVTKETLDMFLNITGTQKSYKLKLKGREIGPVAIGYMYMLKLIHTIDTKLKARTVGNYTRKTIQPASGQGAQRVGEMEIWALIAYDAIQNLKEVNIKSDDLGSKINLLRKLYNTGFADNVELKTEPAALQLFRYYLNSIG